MTPRFRPSAAHRWLACSGSTWVAQLRPEGLTSSYASKGTAEHAHLAAALSGRTDAEFLPKDRDVPVLTAEEIAAVDECANEVRGLAELSDAVIHVERKLSLDYGDGVTISGTADIVLVSDDSLIVIDYKGGAGRRVRAEGNPQISVYLLAAMAEWPRSNVMIGVLQPHGVGEGLDLWSPSVQYLDIFHRSVSAAVLRAFHPEQEYTPGPWCWGCVGAELGMCPAILHSALAVAVGLKEGRGLPDAEPAWWILDHVANLKGVLGHIEDAALVRLQGGGSIPGWRLGSKAGRRRWTNPAEVPAELAALTGTEPAEWMQPEKPAAPHPIGVTEALRDPRVKAIKVTTTEGVEKTVEDLLISKPSAPVLLRDTTEWSVIWDGDDEGDELVS